MSYKVGEGNVAATFEDELHHVRAFRLNGKLQHCTSVRHSARVWIQCGFSASRRFCQIWRHTVDVTDDVADLIRNFLLKTCGYHYTIIPILT